MIRGGMSPKIIGVTVGTPLGPQGIINKLNPVISVNGMKADQDGNVEVKTEAVSDEQIALTVEAYLKDNPPSHRFTINGEEPDENGNFTIDVQGGAAGNVIEF